MLFSMVLNVVIEGIGIERIQEILMNDSPFQIILSASVGLIPNCASSILITELYMKGVLALPAVMAGLLASGGMGLIVLWKNNRDKKENLKITAMLYIGRRNSNEFLLFNGILNCPPSHCISYGTYKDCN